MPVIGGSTGDGIYVFPFKDVPEVFISSYFFSRLQPFESLQAGGQMPGINIAQSNYFCLGKASEPANMIIPHAPNPNVSHPDAIRCIYFTIERRQQRNAKGSQAAFPYEIPALVYWFHFICLNALQAVKNLFSSEGLILCEALK
jgi:hypothetical protein